jgi:hypothetical protein
VGDCAQALGFSKTRKPHRPAELWRQAQGSRGHVIGSPEEGTGKGGGGSCPSSFTWSKTLAFASPKESTKCHVG